MLMYVFMYVYVCTPPHRARQQVMNPEAHGTYQRPLHVFKYMHLHEYMKGKSQSYGGAAVLGSGAVVRDSKRTLHIGASADQEQELKPAAARVSSLIHIRMYVCMYVCIYSVSSLIHICMYVCMYMYIHIYYVLISQ